MIAEFEQMLNQYYTWHKDNMRLRIVNDAVEISTPYLDRHNDCLQILVRSSDNGEYVLSDDGYTLDDLEMCGYNIKSPSHQSYFKVTSNRYGIKINDADNSLEARASIDKLPIKMHNLLQAMVIISNMYLASDSSSDHNASFGDVRNEGKSYD